MRIEKFPVRLAYFDARGEELLAEPASGGLEASGASRRANFELPADLHLYGTGERGIGIDLRGYAFVTYNLQIYGYSEPAAQMKINIPLLTTSSAYALYFESPVPADMDGKVLKDIFREQSDAAQREIVYQEVEDRKEGLRARIQHLQRTGKI